MHIGYCVTKVRIYISILFDRYSSGFLYVFYHLRPKKYYRLQVFVFLWLTRGKEDPGSHVTDVCRRRNHHMYRTTNIPNRILWTLCRERLHVSTETGGRQGVDPKTLDNTFHRNLSGVPWHWSQVSPVQ